MNFSLLKNQAERSLYGNWKPLLFVLFLLAILQGGLLGFYSNFSDFKHVELTAYFIFNMATLLSQGALLTVFSFDNQDHMFNFGHYLVHSPLFGVSMVVLFLLVLVGACILRVVFLSLCMEIAETPENTPSLLETFGFYFRKKALISILLTNICRFFIVSASLYIPVIIGFLLVAFSTFGSGTVFVKFFSTEITSKNVPFIHAIHLPGFFEAIGWIAVVLGIYLFITNHLALSQTNLVLIECIKEDPDQIYITAPLKESSVLMDGRKIEYCALYLSYLLYILLSALPFFAFYAAIYIATTNVFYYEKIKNVGFDIELAVEA